MKFCPECLTYRMLDCFRPHSRAHLGVRNRCADCEDLIWEQTAQRRYGRPWPR